MDKRIDISLVLAIVLLNLVFDFSPASARTPTLPKAFNPISSPGGNYHRVIGDEKACLNVFQISSTWKVMGPESLALQKRKMPMAEFSVPPPPAKVGDTDVICGHLTLHKLHTTSPDPYDVSENVVTGKILFNSTDPVCGSGNAPPRSRLTIVTRSLIDSIHNDSVLPGINLANLKSIFGHSGSPATRLLFYRNNDVSGNIKNCAYIDGNGPAVDMFSDGAEQALFYPEQLKHKKHPPTLALELIVEGLAFGKRKHRGKGKGRQSGLDDSTPGTMALSAENGGQRATPQSSKGGFTNSSERSTSGSCFPADAMVELSNGAHLPMASLSIGDEVKVSAKQYSEVFMFTHKIGNTVNKFVTLDTASGASISLTEGHYIYSNNALMTAAEVRVGSLIRLGTGASDVVTSITFKLSYGLYNPQTITGDIVVNGIQASTYTTAVKPSLAHVVLAPLRAVYIAFGWSTSTFHHGQESLGALAAIL